MYRNEYSKINRVSKKPKFLNSGGAGKNDHLNIPFPLEQALSTNLHFFFPTSRPKATERFYKDGRLRKLAISKLSMHNTESTTDPTFYHLTEVFGATPAGCSRNTARVK